MVVSFFYPKKNKANTISEKYPNNKPLNQKYSKDKIIGLIGIGILMLSFIYVNISNHYMWFPNDRGLTVLILVPIMILGLHLSNRYWKILFGVK